jgi:hypothetical protein
MAYASCTKTLLDLPVHKAEAIAVVNYKIGASSSLLMATITLESFMPADGLHSARSSPVAGDLQEHQRGANLADALEKAAAGKPHKLALVACRQPSLIVGRNGCPLIA